MIDTLTDEQLNELFSSDPLGDGRLTEEDLESWFEASGAGARGEPADGNSHFE